MRPTEPELVGAPSAQCLKSKRLYLPWIFYVLQQPLLCPEVPPRSGSMASACPLPKSHGFFPKYRAATRLGQFGGSFTVKSHRDPVHQQPKTLSWALLPAPGRAAAPLPPPFMTAWSWVATNTWQGWGQQGSLRAARSHCRTSARPVPSRALTSSIVTGCVAQDTMSCMRNSDFISASDM